jgi:hypothetical protein
VRNHARRHRIDHRYRARQEGADSDHVYGGNVLGLVIAVICFLIILAALGWGIYEVYQIGHPAPAKH